MTDKEIIFNIKQSEKVKNIANGLFPNLSNLCKHLPEDSKIEIKVSKKYIDINLIVTVINDNAQPQDFNWFKRLDK